MWEYTSNQRTHCWMTLTHKPPSVEQEKSILVSVFDILSIHERSGSQADWCGITFKGGHEVHVYLPFDEVIQKLREAIAGGTAE